MAVVSPMSRFIEPTNYFPCAHGHMAKLQADAPAISGMADNWSKIEVASVTDLNTSANSLKLSSGKEWTYKSLVLAPGFDHGSHHIKGLEEMATEANNVFVHIIDTKERMVDNYYHGWQH